MMTLTWFALFPLIFVTLLILLIVKLIKEENEKIHIDRD